MLVEPRRSATQHNPREILLQRPIRDRDRQWLPESVMGKPPSRPSSYQVRVGSRGRRLGFQGYGQYPSKAAGTGWVGFEDQIRPATEIESEVSSLGEVPSVDEDEQIALWQARLSAGDSHLAKRLVALVIWRDSDIALEALAALRLPEYEEYAWRAVRAGLNSSLSETRFAAVAAVADLPVEKQEELHGALESLCDAGEPDPDVRRTARGMLRRLRR